MNTEKKFYPLVLDDGGRNLSRRPMQINDCTVRSFAIITKLSYDEVYDTLAEAGRWSHQGFDNTKWLIKLKGKAFDSTFVRMNVGKTSGHPELTPDNFTEYFPRGRYLLERYNHVWAVVNGKHRDLWRVRGDEPLYGAWKLKTKK